MNQKKLTLIFGTFILISIVYFLTKNKNDQSISPLQIDTDKKGLSHYHKREVNNTIRKHMSSIQNCYNQFLEKNPKVSEGKIQFDWQIEPDGDVVKVEKIFSEFDSIEIEKCIQKEISSWSFPPPPEQNRNTYSEFTFHFRKQENLPKQEDLAPKMFNLPQK
jgi:hypothetical protein